MSEQPKRSKEKNDITVVKCSTPSLELGENLQAIIDKIPAAILITDCHDHIQFINREGNAFFGEYTDISEGNDWRQKISLFLDDGVTPYPQHKLPPQLALENGTTIQEEMVLRKGKEENRIWISMTSYPLIFEDRNFEGTITIVQDINHRKEIELSEKRLASQAEVLYRLSKIIAEASNDIHNLSSAVTEFVSETIGDLCLLVLKGNENANFEVVEFSDKNLEVQALVRKVIVQNNEVEEDSLIGGVIKSGEPLLIPKIEPGKFENLALPALNMLIDKVGIESVTCAPLTGRGGTLGAISLYRHRGSRPFNREDQSFLMDIAYRIALAIDNCYLFEALREQISERVEAKTKLNSYQERFRAIFDSTSMGIKVLDMDGKIQQVNPAFRAMIGYSENELGGRHFSEFLYSPDIPRAKDLLKRLRETGIVQYLFEHCAIHKNGTAFWVRTTFSPVRGGNGSNGITHIVGIVENINERKRVELEMRELRNRLQSNVENERLKLAQELHDNPMQVLHSIMYRIEELRLSADSQMAKDLASIDQEVKKVLGDLRAMAKELRPPTIFDFGLENAIRSYTEDFLEKNPNLKISLSLAQDRKMLPQEMRLALFRIYQQALMNILRHSEATQVKVRFAFDAEEVVLEVTDNGKGFVVPRNWIKFVRAGHFGLAGIAERTSSLGGTFKVESNPGEKTTLTFIVPWRGPE